MSSRKLDELASDIDDASITVEELQDPPDTDTDGKLDDLHTTLEKPLIRSTPSKRTSRCPRWTCQFC